MDLLELLVQPQRRGVAGAMPSPRAVQRLGLDGVMLLQIPEHGHVEIAEDASVVSRDSAECDESSVRGEVDTVEMRLT
jgi:hypothetical protein